MDEAFPLTPRLLMKYGWFFLTGTKRDAPLSNSAALPTLWGREGWKEKQHLLCVQFAWILNVQGEESAGDNREVTSMAFKRNILVL